MQDPKGIKGKVAGPKENKSESCKIQSEWKEKMQDPKRIKVKIAGTKKKIKVKVAGPK